MSNDGENALDRAVVEYLRTRGHTVSRALLDEIDADDAGEKGEKPGTMSVEEFVKTVAVFASKPSRPTENALTSSANVIQELSAVNNPPSIQNLIASIGTVGAEEILAHDPTDKYGGFAELEAWVDGSLDMYRPQFRPILFPIFCHFYLDLIQHAFKEAALRFFKKFSPSFPPVHDTVLHHLSTLLLPSHVQNDELAQRFRNEKYVIRMSRSAFGLLLGWLTEGTGGEAPGTSNGFSGERGKRGRSSVMRVVNNHLQFDVTNANPMTVSKHAWEENTGLLSSLVPSAKGAKAPTSPQAFNASKPDLKLGPAPIPQDLRMEAERSLREQSLLDSTSSLETKAMRDAKVLGLTSPEESELLPHPPTFMTSDLEREISRFKDERKQIRLEPSALVPVNTNSTQGNGLRPQMLPSICAYTLHDIPEGAPCITFSQDTTLMAAGFAESYVRVWSLNGEKLRGYRSDFSTNTIRDVSALRRIKEKTGSTSRKLIGHSGPVYSVDFDPLNGSAAPPKYLLSCSADATTRLWSMDTLTNIVAYRGHENPVWDVKWSPMGIYFATASRDHTARLWSTDRTSSLRIYAGHLSDVDCVQFHPNSLYLATGSSDWTARLWDVQRGNCVRVFVGHQGGLSALAISPDGRYLASAGQDLAINLWDLGSGKRIKKMTGHASSVYTLAFSHESSLLVSGGADWTVRCWDVKSPGGPAPPAQNGLANGDTGHTSSYGEAERTETVDLLATFPTKRTPITNIQFTPRNLCLAGGVCLPPLTR
ncbi:TFIID and SAGA subunit [Fistulina hepatica ATCC 64428]|uniref:TFIID and SAGA subunit n=1 Tax=Fistulina hepatica ATCC 64428 TaxID=1128425 RepID=A0A0D7AI67_9AGAR|nr:TFIID and SAGA subunit [Fistulina hepatica ATCC 64428]